MVAVRAVPSDGAGYVAVCAISSVLGTPIRPRALGHTRRKPSTILLCERMHFVIGTPERVAAQLAAWQEAYGFDEILCQLYAAGMRHEDALRSLELLGREVLPHLQSGPRR